MALSLALAPFVLSGCAGQAAPAAQGSGPSTSFVNKVWRVKESTSVAPGTFYVFLEDGTLVVTSPHGKPALGKWKRNRGGLAVVEEGIPYSVEVLALSRDTFKVRIRNPGVPVDITLVPAAQD
jgi:hypothetical protein